MFGLIAQETSSQVSEFAFGSRPCRLLRIV